MQIFDPVIRVRHVISCLNSKRREISGGKAPIAEDSTTPRCKKLKTSSSSKGELLVDQSRDAEKETDVREMKKGLVSGSVANFCQLSVNAAKCYSGK